MSLAEYGFKRGSQHECLLLTGTGPWGPVQYLLVNDRLRGQEFEKRSYIYDVNVFLVIDREIH